MRLPEIVGDTWFNSKPLVKDDLAGKVVLADFWTYSCVNCQRTLPYLRQWHEWYQDKDFVLLGIHTPEFDFEKEANNVEQAIKDLNVTWPVVLDSDHINWNNFSNKYWPAKYLADREGNIVYTHFGEGSYDETEREIQKLLAGNESTLPEVDSDEHAHGSVCFPPTPEAYSGYGRGSLANAQGYQRDHVADYTRPSDVADGQVGLVGSWQAAGEYVESKAPGAELLLTFHATEVNLVMEAIDGEAQVEILLDGNPLAERIRGREVGSDGKVIVTKSTLYNLLRSADLVAGTLSLRAVSGNWRGYAFTFSGCEDND